MILKRRAFIKKTAMGSAGVGILAAAGSINSCSGKDSDGNITLALIGAGKRGIEVASGMCSEPGVSLKYVCDVNRMRAENGIKILSSVPGIAPQSTADMNEIFNDKEVDAVIIATPEHWNGLASIMACRAKKDVYVETSPSHCLWEGRKLAEAAKKYKRIVQTGFQNRSAGSLSSAREYIASGKLGPIVQIKAYNISAGSKWTQSPDTDIPEGINWDAWLGPAGSRSFNTSISDVTDNGGWENYWDFSGGSLSVKASHILDIARFVTGNPGHPLSVYCCGGNRIWNSSREIPELQEITWDYGKYVLTCVNSCGSNYMKSSHTEGSASPDWLRVPDRLEVYGTNGLMYIGQNGQGWQVIGTDDKILAQGKDPENPDKIHFSNFINSIRTRTEPVANAEQGHLSAALVHLGNIAFRTGNKKLLFDGIKEEFINDKEADRLLKKTYRDAYMIPEKI